MPAVSEADSTQLRRRLAEQAALATLSQNALDGSDPIGVMQKAVIELTELLEVDAAGILERIPSGDFLVRAGWGAGYEVDRVTGGTGLSPAVLAMKTQEPVIVEDFATDRRFSNPPLLIEWGIVSGVNIVIPARRRNFGVLGVWSRRKRVFTRDDVSFLQGVTNVIGGMIARTEVERALADALADQERRLNHQEVLALCASKLLGSTDLKHLDEAMRVLMEAIQSGLAWVQFKDEQGLGGLPMSRHRIYRTLLDATQFEAYWDAFSWDELPSIRDQLELGRAVSVDPTTLPPVEQAIYGDSPWPITVETDLPIMADGKWLGTLSFVDENSGAHPHTSSELAYLQTAASMIGSWWQAARATEKLKEVVVARERSLRLEKAVASTAQALSTAAGPEAMAQALKALVQAIDASSVFVERNVTDEVRGLCSQVVASVRRDGAGYDPEYWDMMPWTSMPTSFAELSVGREMVVVVSQLEGPERETYINSEVRSEIDLPIMVNGRWVGLIGCADEEAERGWDDERELLKTVARVIGAAWQRDESENRLERLVESKDEFLAAISHELRTPLTAVVGLARTMQYENLSLTEEEKSEFISTIAEQATEVSNLVQDLLVAARSDIGHIALFPERLDLANEVDWSLRGIPNVEPIEVLCSSPVWALADPLRTRQIIRNLVTNALRYGGPVVQIEIAAAGVNATIQVRDNGSGIPVADRQLIFEPYGRAHHVVGQPASIGLGLTVSRQLAEWMGGSLAYEFDDGWSRFVLTLPGR